MSGVLANSGKTIKSYYFFYIDLQAFFMTPNLGDLPNIYTEYSYLPTTCLATILTKKQTDRVNPNFITIITLLKHHKIRMTNVPFRSRVYNINLKQHLA